MSKRVRMIKDYKTRTQGETWSPTDRVAKQLIAGGFAAEVEEEEESDTQSESADEDEEEVQEKSPSSDEETEEEVDEETDPESESTEEDEDEPAASDDEEEDDTAKPEAQNSSLDNVPAGELASLDRPGIAPSVNPHGLAQKAQTASPQRSVAAPLPARYAAHRSHIRPR